jgi:hypothetical protein
MQNGDLSEHRPERLIVVLEGVLALVVSEKALVGRWRKHEETTGYHVMWHEVPLLRLVSIARRHSQYRVEIVTFFDQRLADQAAEYLTMMEIPYAEISAVDYDQFCFGLRFQPEVRAVYDSDPDRLDGYGQAGHAVVRGNDF